MFYYEDMKSDVLFLTKSDTYICRHWQGVSPRRIEDKDILVVTTNCYDEGLHDFINTYGKFDIKFTTSAKNSDWEERYVLNNICEDMHLLLHQSSFRRDSITEHVFVFGNDLTTEQDAINVLNEEMKEEIINEVVKRIVKINKVDFKM